MGDPTLTTFTATSATVGATVLANDNAIITELVGSCEVNTNISTAYSYHTLSNKKPGNGADSWVALTFTPYAGRFRGLSIYIDNITTFNASHYWTITAEHSTSIGSGYTASAATKALSPSGGGHYTMAVSAPFTGGTKVFPADSFIRIIATATAGTPIADITAVLLYDVIHQT